MKDLQSFPLLHIRSRNAFLRIALAHLLLFLSGCNDLAVFLNSSPYSEDFQGLKTVELNADGQFELSWDLPSKKGPRANSYEIYLLKTNESPETLGQLQLTDDKLVSTAELSSEANTAPSTGGTLVGTVEDTNRYVFNKETIDPESYYIFEVKSKSASPSSRKKTRMILSKVNFNNISSAVMKVAQTQMTVSWDAVVGANSYQIFDGPDGDKPIFTVTENSIALNYLQASAKKDYCLRAVRGTLRSKSCMTLDGIGSSLKPWVTQVSTPLNAGFYREGDVLTFDLKFSDTVRVSRPGDLRLPLVLSETGHRYAYYDHGDGSDTLVFNYTVRAGDNTVDLKFLPFLEEGAEGSVSDAQDRKASLDLTSVGPSPGKVLVVDTTAPGSPQSVGFPSAKSNSLVVPVAWSGGDDANFLNFNVKLCETSGCTTDCEAAVTSPSHSASLPGINGKSYFACVQAVDKVGLVSPWIGSIQTIMVDNVPPAVVRVTSTSANGAYTTGAVIPLQVDFTENVLVTNPSEISLLIKAGSVNRQAVYVSGAGTSSLVFEYTVAPGDTTADLDYVSSGSLLIGGASSITDYASNVAMLTLPNPASANSLSQLKSIVFDTTAPSQPTTLSVGGSATSTSPTINASWTASIDTNFKQHQARLCPTASCDSGCLATTTAVGTSASLVGVDGSTYYACVRGEDKVGLFSAWAASSSIAIDATPPTILGVTSSLADGFYTTGQIIPITITFSEAVTAIAGSGIELDLSLSTRKASLVPAAPSATLSFSYTVQAGDNSSDLNYAGVSSLGLLSGASIRDAAGNNAVLSLPAAADAGSLGTNKQLVIDSTAPLAPTGTAVSSTTSANTSYGVSWTNATDTNFKQHNVKLCTVSDCLTGCLSPGSALGSPATLTGLASTSYFGCVQGEDQVGLKTAWAVSSGTLLVDDSPPIVSQVSSTLPNAAYPLAAVIPITVRFNEAVFVTNPGQLALTLETGATDRVLSLSRGSGTTTLEFDYTVQAGDEAAHLDYPTVNALSLGTSGIILDAAGNAAIITLPAPGSTNSLFGQKTFVIDSVAPAAPTSVGFLSATSTSPSFDVNWLSGTDTNFKTNNVKLCSLISCASVCTSAVSSATQSVTLTGVADGAYYACVQGEDHAGQKSAWINSTNPITVDATAPLVTKVTSSTVDGSYKAGVALNIKVEFTEPLVLINGSDLTLLLRPGSSDRAATFDSLASNIINFTYTVQAGDSASDLNYVATNSLSLGTAGLIKDGAGNNAVRTLPALNNTNSLAGQKNFILDTTAPTPTFTSPAAGTVAAGSLPIAITCETGNSVNITGNLSSALNGLVCASNALARTVFFASGEGNKTVTLTETDLAGNVGTLSRIFVNDNVAPALTQTTKSATTYSAGSTLAIGGACESGLDVVIKLSGTEEGRATCTSSVWTYTTATQSSDGTRVYSLSQTDAAGNQATTSVTWIRDTLAPTFTFSDLSSTFGINANSNSYTFQGNCDSSASVSNPSILITGPGITGSASVSCTLGSWSYLTPTQTNGVYIYTFVQTDSSGNATTIHGTWTRNTAGPVFTTPTVLVKSKLNQVSFSGNCDINYPISISGPNSPSAPTCTSGTWNFTTPLISSDGNSVFVLTQTSTAGDSTHLSLTFLRDATPPVITAMSINNGATSTLSYRTLIGITATDLTTPITSVCILQKVWPDSSTSPAAPALPLSTDSCWQTLTSIGMSSAKSVTITDMDFILSLASGKYSTYGFVRDEVGNISALADTDSVGRATITLNVPVPPTISIIDVTNALEVSQAEFAAGDEVDIHWSLTGGTGIGTSPISVQWSTDDGNWTNYTSSLSNSGTNCTPVSGATGCYRLTSPTASYFRLQVTAVNSATNTYFAVSKALNTGGKIRQIAGRTFKGLGGNARGFQVNFTNMDNLVLTSANNFVVTRQGTIYVIDTALGILKMDPKDQIATVIFPKAAFVAGTPLSGVKFASPSSIWLDQTQPLQRLWVNDGYNLRVVNFNTNTVATYNSSTTANVFGNFETKEFFPSKSGLYTNTYIRFNGGGGAWLLTKINESTGKYEVMRVDNPAPYLPQYDALLNANCEGASYHSHPLFGNDGTLQQFVVEAFYYAPCNGHYALNVNNSTFTASFAGLLDAPGMPASLPGNIKSHPDVKTHMGLNGLLYKFVRQGGGQTGAYVYDQTANTWTKVLGLANTSTPVYQLSCADGTLSTLCDIDLNSLFVDEVGTIYFMDQGQIRIVDASGKVQTIFGSSFRKIADDLPATDTVLGDFVNYFQRRIDAGTSKEEVVYSHFPTRTYRRVTDSRISVLAGNGLDWNNATSSPASGRAPGIVEGVWTLSNNLPFAMDVSGNLFVGDYENGQGATIFKLSRSNLTWNKYIPFTCTSCVSIADNIFDPAAGGTFNSANKVKLNSAFLWAPSPISPSYWFTQVRPIIHGMNGTKLIMQTQDPSIRYDGPTDGTWLNLGYYGINTMISAADTSYHDGTTVTNFRRIIGTKGASMQSAHTDVATSWIKYTVFPPSGTAANAFDLNSIQHGGKVPLTNGFHEYDGAYYGVLTYSAPNKLLKVSNNVVTYITTSLNMRNFTLVKSGTDDILYYCSTTGLLKKRNLTTSSESTVDLLIPGATCSGSQMMNYQTAGVNYLMFVYTQNALNGIVELKITP